MAENSLRQWLPTPASNTDVGGVTLVENVMKPSDVNNAVRAMMGQTAQYLVEMSYPTAGGTANALTLTPTTALAALTANQAYTFNAASANTTAATLAVSGLTAKAIRKIVGGTDVALAANDIQANGRYTVVYDTAANAAAGAWILTNLAAGSLSSVTAINGGQLAGFRNSLINGNLLVWQRGTSIAIVATTAAYTADRWAVTQLAGTVAITVARQASPVSGVAYSQRVQRNSANTNVNVIHDTQVIETINCAGMQGQTVNLSFYAKCGANFSAASSLLVSKILTGTGSDEGLASVLAATWTGQATTSTQNNTVSTSRALFTQSVAIPAGATEIAVDFSYTPVGTASTNDWFEVDSIQLEPGAVPTPIEARGFGTESALALRYYQKTFLYVTKPADNAGVGGSLTVVPLGATGFLAYFWQFPRMRVAPTVVTYNPGTAGTAAWWRNASDTTSSQPLVASTGENGVTIYLNNAGSKAWASEGWGIHATLEAEL